MKIPSFKHDFLGPKTLLFFSSLLVVPSLIALGFLYTKAQKIAAIEEKVVFLQKKTEKNKQARLREEKILAQIQSAKPDSLNDQASRLSFLIPEKQKWQMFTANPEPSREIREKYFFLEEENNKLEFLEKDCHKGKAFEERELSLKKPVRLNREDLQKLLSFIEGKTIGPYTPSPTTPPMMITSFSLEKSILPEIQGKVYTTSMQLLIRQNVK